MYNSFIGKKCLVSWGKSFYTTTLIAVDYEQEVALVFWDWRQFSSSTGMLENYDVVPLSAIVLGQKRRRKQTDFYGCNPNKKGGGNDGSHGGNGGGSDDNVGGFWLRAEDTAAAG